MEESIFDFWYVRLYDVDIPKEKWLNYLIQFVLYLEEYLMYEHHTWDSGSMWHQDGPLTYILHSSDFVLYLEDYKIEEHHV